MLCADSCTRVGIGQRGTTDVKPARVAGQSPAATRDRAGTGDAGLGPYWDGDRAAWVCGAETTIGDWDVMEGKPCAHHSPRVRNRTSATIPTLAANAPCRPCKPCEEPAPAHYPQNASNERCSGSAKNKKFFLGAWQHLGQGAWGLAAMAKLRLTTLASMPGLSPWSGPRAHVELALGVSLLLATARPCYVPPLGQRRCSTCSTDPRCRIHPSPTAATAAEPGKESLGWAPVRGMLERVSRGLAPPLSHQHVDPLAVWRAWKSEWETGASPAAAGTMLKHPLM